MIIKIEELPQGQQIKHLNIDVTFDNTGTNVKVETIPETQKIPTKTASIDIPDEMTDTEF